MTADIFLFWLLALMTLGAGLTVITVTNPIYSALALAGTMIGVSALFVTLNAYFLAGVQLIVYAGAVTVLFVMVLMLFDLKHEVAAFSRGKIEGAIKLGAATVLAGLLIGTVYLVSAETTSPTTDAAPINGAKELGQHLFKKYIFGFEALGILLLIIAVGAVALARSKGGTHAKRS